MIARLICGCLCGAARTMVATSDSLSRKSSIPDSGLSCLDLDGYEARSGRRMTSELPAPIFILQNWITHACLQSKEAQWHMWEVTFTLLSRYSVIPGIPCDSCVSWGSLVNCPTRWSLSLIFGFLWWSSIFLYPDNKEICIAQQCATSPAASSSSSKCPHFILTNSPFVVTTVYSSSPTPQSVSPGI